MLIMFYADLTFLCVCMLHLTSHCEMLKRILTISLMSVSHSMGKKNFVNYFREGEVKTTRRYPPHTHTHSRKQLFILGLCLLVEYSGVG